MARRRPLASGLIQAMSSPTVHTFQPSKPFGGISMAKLVLPQALGKRRRDVGLLALADPRRRGSACAPPSSLRRARCSRRCAARSISCPAARCRRSPSRSDQISRVSGKCTMYFSLLHGHGTSFCPAASGAPTRCMHGTTRLSSLSISWNTGRPMRAMMRMFTTTYGESVSCTPICDIGEPTGPMLNGSTYIVRPAHAAVEQLLQLLAHLERVLPSCWWARRCPSRASR